MTLRLASFRTLCVPDPMLPLPSHDALDVPHGANFPDVFVRLHKRRAGSAGKTNDLRGGLAYTFIGNEISALDLLLKVHPCVREVRCNYPLVLPRPPTRRGGRSSRPKMVLIDRMLTVVLKSRPDRWHLHALFVQEKKLRLAEEFLSGFGAVSFELISISDLCRVEVRNAAQCYQWLLGLDIRELKEEAQHFATELQALYNRKRARAISLDAFIGKLASVMRCDRDHGYRLLGTAIVYGFVELDHTDILWMPRPLKLREGSAS